MTASNMPLERLGPIVLAPGVRRAQVLVYILVVCTATAMSQFMAMIQPYVFNEILHIPVADQGKLAGNLAAMQQAAVFVLVPLFGALSDKLGRRFFLIVAVVGMTIGTAAYPLASSILSLYLIRFFFGAATTAHTAGGAPMIMDLPDNGSRGRFLSLMLITQTIFTTIFVSFIGTRLPKWLEGAGIDRLDAGRFTFWTIAAIGAVGCAFAIFGLARNRAAARIGSIGAELKGVAASMAEVFRHAGRNRRFRVLLVASIVMRSDSAIVASFLSLWVVSSAREAGVGTSEAMIAFGSIQAFSAVLHVVLPVVAGFVADRVNRLAMLLVSLVMTTIAFGSTWFVTDVLGWGLYAVVVLISIAESVQSVSSQALLGQEAPPHLRGACYGMFALLGVASVIVVSIVCGYLFDRIGYNAPFLLIAALSLLFIFVALAILRRPDAERADGMAVPAE